MSNLRIRGLVKVADCCEVGGHNNVECAEVLAKLLNSPFHDKNKAYQKDEILKEVVGYLLSVDSESVPGFLRQAVLEAYEV